MNDDALDLLINRTHVPCSDNYQIVLAELTTLYAELSTHFNIRVYQRNNMWWSNFTTIAYPSWEDAFAAAIIAATTGDF